MPTAVLQYRNTLVEGTDAFAEIGILFKNASRNSGNVTFKVASSSSALYQTDFSGDPEGEVAYNFLFDNPGDIFLPLARLNLINDQISEGDDALIIEVSAPGWTFENGSSTDVATLAIRDNDFSGTTGNDNIAGTALADSLFGLGGDDILNGGAGNDYIDGGQGIDRVSYAGFFRSYATTSVPGALTVRGGANEGTDTLANVEYTTFKDGVFVNDPESAGAKIVRLYDAVFGRVPDDAGLDFYVDRAEEGGMPLIAIANELSSSAEFQKVTGGLSNSQFVNYVFEQTLGRQADPEAATFYTGLLDSGAWSRGTFVVDVSESAEHRGLTADVVSQGYFNTDDTYQSVSLLYDSFLGRLPDAAGISFYGERLKSGSLSFEQVSAQLADSAEFKSATQGFSNAQLVDFVFENTLDRAADPVGRAFYIERLGDGMAKAAFVQEVAFSAEHYNLMTPFIVDGIQLG